MDQWNTLASDESIDKTIHSLKEHGIEAEVVEDQKEAKKMVLELIPEGVEVMTMTSETLRVSGIADEINNSSKYTSVRNKLNFMDRAKESLEMQKLGGAPEYSVGSVHAVTEDGKVVIASNTGSQLGSYSGGSLHVIWVVGTQKIVSDLDSALKRIYEYVLPLESERAKKAYGTSGSFVSKLLIVNKEVVPGRLKIIFVKEKLGF